jgi:hypothetical protein
MPSLDLGFLAPASLIEDSAQVPPHLPRQHISLIPSGSHMSYPIVSTRKPLTPFIAYLAFFYIAWGWLWVHVTYPRADDAIGAATLSYALIGIAFRTLIWVLPVVIYLRYIDRVPPFEFLQLTRNWKRGLLIGLVIAAIDFLGTLARRGPPDWHALYITWNGILSTSILFSKKFHFEDSYCKNYRSGSIFGPRIIFRIECRRRDGKPKAISLN